MGFSFHRYLDQADMSFDHCLWPLNGNCNLSVFMSLCPYTLVPLALPRAFNQYPPTNINSITELLPKFQNFIYLFIYLS